MSSATIADYQQKAANAEQARRLALSELEKWQLAVHDPRLRRFMLAVLDLMFAADVGKGRGPFDGSSPNPHPDDRPLPHEPTEQRRRQLEAVMRDVDRMTARIHRHLGDETDWTDPRRACPTCSRSENPGRHFGRARREAKKFLAETLVTPQPATVVKDLAEERGIRPRTLERAADDLGVVKTQQSRMWVWNLPAGDER